MARATDHSLLEAKNKAPKIDEVTRLNGSKRLTPTLIILPSIEAYKSEVGVSQILGTPGGCGSPWFAQDPGRTLGGHHQPHVPVSPLNGPTMSLVIQPP
jgi:hypothetical protein